MHEANASRTSVPRAANDESHIHSDDKQRSGGCEIGAGKDTNQIRGDRGEGYAPVLSGMVAASAYEQLEGDYRALEHSYHGMINLLAEMILINYTREGVHQYLKEVELYLPKIAVEELRKMLNAIAGAK